ncbi:guanine nucleotide-binding protein alpha-1 subunit isoform X2 [Oryza glaberrima]|uniref:guanine nucleotide-binding protein alpha-1 subunit isoform X2 n=1 Tax=Oryza glaberrima TaxID=4538 RepID=UPI00224BFEC5|nr:guanine nucleotide-binding protein alpha-1 subunit isoform X2 [Oryza glaberrima]
MQNLQTLTGEFCKRQKQSNTSTSSYFLVRENQGSLRYLNRLSSFSKLALMRLNLGAIHQLSMQMSFRQLKYAILERILYEGAKELSQVESDSSKYVISPDNQEIGEKLSDIDGRLDYPLLNKELVLDVKRLWQDPAIQETYLRGSILQLPDCAQYFMENLDRLAEAGYVPTKEDVLYARVRTNGVVQIQFSPVGENKRGGEVYRLYDVGGQRNERRKWIHLFEGVNAVIFCAAISEYDQMLFEDETKNRMMETKELFDWVLKQRCFEKTSFILFLNKFDIFEKKIQKVPLSVCEWFKDYQPIAPGKQEVEHAYEFVKKKFEELYFQSSKPDRVDRVFKIYRTTALDQKLVKKTFKLIDESMRRSREGT